MQFTDFPPHQERIAYGRAVQNPLLKDMPTMVPNPTPDYLRTLNSGEEYHSSEIYLGNLLNQHYKEFTRLFEEALIKYAFEEGNYEQFLNRSIHEIANLMNLSIQDVWYLSKYYRIQNPANRVYAQSSEGEA